MIEPIKPPLRVELVEGDENARVLVDANGFIVCLTSVKYAEQLADAMNLGLARMAIS